MLAAYPLVPPPRVHIELVLTDLALLRTPPMHSPHAITSRITSLPLPRDTAAASHLSGGPIDAVDEDASCGEHGSDDDDGWRGLPRHLSSTAAGSAAEAEALCIWATKGRGWMKSGVDFLRRDVAKVGKTENQAVQWIREIMRENEGDLLVLHMNTTCISGHSKHFSDV